MLKSYQTIAWRNLMKNKNFSFINITGLTIGITVCMMIFLFIMNEFSIDRFHRNADRIFRVMREYDKGKPPVAYLSGLLFVFAGLAIFIACLGLFGLASFTAAKSTPMYWWIFVMAAGTTILIALITVSFKAVQAGLANPTKSLRAE